MASKKIPDMPAADPLNGTEEFHLVQGPNSRHALLSTLATWILGQVPAVTGVLRVANNLGDLASAVTARVNLGLGSAATFASSAFLQVASNLSDVANVATARTNLSVYSKAEVDAAIAGSSPSGMPFENAVTKPAAANFTVQNLAGGSIASTFADYAKGVAMLQLGSIGATNQIRFARHDVIVSGTPFTMTARLSAIDPQQPIGQASQGALVLRNSANGRMILFGDGGGGVTSYVQIFSTYTSGQLGQYTAFSVSYQFPWKRIVSDGTNLTFWVSKDGYYWVQAAAGTTIANYIGVVDEIGIGLQAIASVATAHGTLCQSFTVTFP